MTEPYQEDFLVSGGETYDDVPSGEYAPLTNIGHAKTSRGWKVFVDADTAHEGEYAGFPNPLSRGFYYLPGDKEKALAFVKKYLGRDFVSQHMLTAMPVASITNMSEENKKKFTSGRIEADTRVAGLPKDYTSPERKWGHGLSLVVIPSILDAYARFRGYYTDVLFDPALVGGNTVLADIPAEFYEKLAQQRKNIFAAYGEDTAKNKEIWRSNSVADVTSPRLKDALSKLVNASWEAWIRMGTVLDPSPGAYYTKADDNGDMKAHRNRVQVVLQFFKNEREATTVGQAELAAFSGAAPTSSANGSSVGFAWEQLSALAQKNYGDLATFSSIVADIKRDTRPPVIVAKEYMIEVADVNLVK